MGSCCSPWDGECDGDLTKGSNRGDRMKQTQYVWEAESTAYTLAPCFSVMKRYFLFPAIPTLWLSDKAVMIMAQNFEFHILNYQKRM